MEKRDILVIFGPTASGKSKLATQIASKHKSAIINFDSLQVYKDLKILTDRPDDEICKKFDHRLYGMLKGNESCSAAIWLEKAEHEINNCFDNKLLPIVVGGTGLYLKALMDGLSEIPSIKKNIEEQAKLDLETHGLDHLYKKILTKYPGTKINSNDKQRIMRSYSLLLQTGKVLEEWQFNPNKKIDNVNYRVILTGNLREKLYESAEQRVDNMFHDGAVDEVQSLIEKNYSAELSIMKAIGVREITNFIEGKVSLDEAKSIMKKNTRNYIKRQDTWIKSNNITQNVDIKKYL